MEVLVHTDTGWEREVTYKRVDNYELDNSLKLVAMIRLARAMEVLQIDPTTDGVQNYRLTICRSSELIGPEVEKDEWMPFDPSRFKPFKECIRDAEKRAR